jgi:hypothetical protein
MKKRIILNAAITLAAGFGGLLLLTLGQSRGILTPREQALGMLALAIGLGALMVFLARQAVKKSHFDNATFGPTKNDLTIKQSRSKILLAEARIGALAALLLLGVIIGVREHELLPVLAGGAMCLLTIYIKLQRIKMLKKLK